MLESVEEFLAYAVRLEREAADRFAQLADAMKSCGNDGCRQTVSKAFRIFEDASGRSPGPIGLP